MRPFASVRDLVDVSALAERQLDHDRDRTARFPRLFSRKLQRMSASPLAFLRGAAPLFYEMLASRRELADGPEGEGILVGDLHLENFGAYRPVTSARRASAKHPARFDLNDFDDAIVGAWRLDLLRLTTSLILGGRELGADGMVVLELCDRLLEAWAHAVFDDAKAPPVPPPVAALVHQASSRSRKALLDARTEIVRGKARGEPRRAFVRGARYAELPKAIARAVPRAFADYVASVSDDERPGDDACEVLDAALRIAGTGSLGGVRIAVLTRGKGGADGAFIFDLKEAGTPSAAPLCGRPRGEDPAERVIRAFRACVARPPRALGQTRIGATRLYGRRLAPQEDKLDLRRLRASDLPALADHLGALVGRAHARAATKAPPAAWTKADRDAIRTRAITLAGIHEAVYIALCDRMRLLLARGTPGR